VNPDFSLQWQQVCDSFGKFLFAPSHDGAFNRRRPDFGFLHQWSTEGSDLFVYGQGTDIRQTFVVEADGSTTLDQRNGYNAASLCRVDSSSATLGQSIEVGAVLGPNALTILPGVWPHDNVENIHFAADGQSVLCDVFPGGENAFALRDAATGNTLWTAVYGQVQGSQWSPLGGTIALSEGHDGIWLMPADRSGYGTPVKIHSAPNKSLSTSTEPRWSPGASHLDYVEFVPGGATNTFRIYRMKNDGSSVVNLTSDLSDAALKWPYRWVSNNTAP
jgi:hypothetical protein